MTEFTNNVQLPTAKEAYALSKEREKKVQGEAIEKEWEMIVAVIKESIDLGITECSVNRPLFDETIKRLKDLGYGVITEDYRYPWDCETIIKWGGIGSWWKKIISSFINYYRE